MVVVTQTAAATKAVVATVVDMAVVMAEAMEATECPTLALA